MKSIFLTFSFLMLLLSCNSGNKKISLAEIIEAPIDTIKTVEKPELKITKNFVLGKFDYKTDSTFIKMNLVYTAKEIYLNIEVADAFFELYNAAKKDGIELKIRSGTRNFKEQKAIWERKWEKYKNLEPTERAQKILQYSSMPSSSRHHWGTDLDLNSLSNSYFSSGKGFKEYEWLTIHANDFGFYQVYTEKNTERTGYNLEKWHWSYLPLASQYLEFYNKHIINADVNGFKGFEQAAKLRIINDYVNGISKKAKEYK